MAAGLSVGISLEVCASHSGSIREVVRILAEDGFAEVAITGQVDLFMIN